jgi:hypothetical protein
MIPQDDSSSDEIVRSAYKFYNASLMDRVFDAETSMAMQGNLLVLPQACLIVRNIVEIMRNTNFILTANY